MERIPRDKVKKITIYYVWCNRCGKKVEDFSDKELLKEIRDWRYDYEKDEVLCEECVEIWRKE